MVFDWPGCVTPIGTPWKAPHGQGDLAGARSAGAAPLACFWPLLFFRLERLRNVMLRSLLRQGQAPSAPPSLQSCCAPLRRLDTRSRRIGCAA
jgi:hypothetical protein